MKNFHLQVPRCSSNDTESVDYDNNTEILFPYVHYIKKYEANDSDPFCDRGDEGALVITRGVIIANKDEYCVILSWSELAKDLDLEMDVTHTVEKGTENDSVIDWEFITIIIGTSIAGFIVGTCFLVNHE